MFRISALVLTALSLCLCSSVRADDAEDEALALVNKLNGKVTRDVRAPEQPVVAVDLNFKEITDAGLKELAALKSLTSLDLRFTETTDAGLKELAALKNLTALDLRLTKITDAGLKELAALKNLTTLKLYSEKVTNAGSRNSPHSRASPHLIWIARK